MRLPVRFTLKKLISFLAKGKATPIAMHLHVISFGAGDWVTLLSQFKETRNKIIYPKEVKFLGFRMFVSRTQRNLMLS